MFAPHCPACGHRVLLGTGRVVAANLQDGDHLVILRCFCGELVRGDQQPPVMEAEPAPPAPLVAASTGR